MTYEELAKLFASHAGLGKGKHHNHASTTKSASPRFIYFPNRPDTVEGMPYSAWDKYPFDPDTFKHLIRVDAVGESFIYVLAPASEAQVVRPPFAHNSVPLTSAPIHASVQPTDKERPKKIIIDDAFLREWEPRYDRIASDEPEYRRLVKLVANDIATTETISKVTFLAIWTWKGAMRVIRFVNMAEYESRYAEAFRRAASSPPQRRLHLLLGAGAKLPGVEAATGSTLLHFMDPETMPIIDVRTIGVLFPARLISTSQKDLEHYEEFRQAVLGIRSRCPAWTLRQIDRALFAYHTEVIDKLNQRSRCGLS